VEEGKGGAKKIYLITESGKFSKDYALRDQIRRAAISVMSNISEGMDRDGEKELIQFLSVSKGSAGELKSQLYLALDIEYIDEEKLKELMALFNEISRMLGGFIKYLKKSNYKGRKFKRD
jgi:four helix bundle protein